MHLHKSISRHTVWARGNSTGLVARDEPLGHSSGRRLGRVGGRRAFRDLSVGEPWPPARRAYAPEGTEEKTSRMRDIDLLLRQCLNSEIHYTTSVDVIRVED